MTLPSENTGAHHTPYVDDQIAVDADDLAVRHYRPESIGSGEHAAADSGVQQKAADTRDEAVSQAAEVKDSVVEAGSHVASVAKDQAGAVVAEAGNRVQDLLSQTRGELSGQAGTQQQRLAGGLHSLGDELHSMASGNEHAGLASELTRQAAQRAKSVAGWLEVREPGDVLHDVAAFARRRPGLFIALSAGAGLVAGRLARGLRDDASADSTPATVATSANADGTTAGDSGSTSTTPVGTYGAPAYDAPVHTGGVR